jgi:ABC-type lipoprotein export system ATPase subunit
VIICDEPTAALDSSAGEAVMNILSEVASNAGRAVVAVTHDRRIYSFADRLIELEDGRIKTDRINERRREKRRPQTDEHVRPAGQEAA